MQPLTSQGIYGNWCTLLLPVNQGDSIDYYRLEAQIDAIISMKVNGIYTNGTAGEFDSQTEDEFDRISLLVSQKCETAKIPFQIGCSHTSSIISLERVKRAVGWKPGAIQVILPDWCPPNINEVTRFLEKIATAADPVGLVIYNPPHAKRQLTPEEYAGIIRNGIPLVGCKTGGGDESWYQKMKNSVPDLSLFVPGHTLASAIRKGARGAYSNVACINPSVAQQWYKMMIDGDARALELEKRIQEFIVDDILPYITEKGYSSPAVDKFLAAVGGWADIGTRLRWPYQGIPENEIDGIREHGRKVLPEFFPIQQ